MDDQARRDAMADAETLWAVAHEVDDGAINLCWLLLRAREASHQAKGHMAYALALHAIDVEQEIGWATSESRNAAHAAMLAVPALKGD